MSAEAFQLRKLKCKLWKRYCFSKADCDYSTFKDASNRLRSLTIYLRCQHEVNLVSNIANNPRSVWRYVNSTLKGWSNMDAIQHLDGSLASSDQEKAELLNSYFSSVFTHENLTNIPTLESKDDTPQLDDMAISPSMVCSVITKLKSEKSTGPNSWPIEVTKQCSQQISIPLSIINFLTNLFGLVFFLKTAKLPTSLQYIRKVPVMLQAIIDL